MHAMGDVVKRTCWRCGETMSDETKDNENPAIDHEIAALQAIVREMARLNEGERERVLSYLAARFGKVVGDARR